MYRYAMANDKGVILQITNGPYLYIPCGENVSDDTHYVDVSDVDLKAKQSLKAEKSIEGLTVTLTGLPSGLTVETNGFSAVTDSEPMAISYDVPGTYQIRLSGLVEYLDYTEEVTVGDP